MAEHRTKRFTFAAKNVSKPLDVLRLSGTEGLSRLYQFEVDIVARTEELSFDDIVGHSAALEILGREADRHVHGMVARIDLLHVREEHAVYRVLLVPPHAKLALRRKLRVYQARTTRQIVTRVLREAGITRLQWRLSADYKPRDYCVQYRETDLDFVTRLLEEEGIAFHFDHDDSDVTTVFTDQVAAFSTIEGPATLVYREETGLDPDQESVAALSYGQQLGSGYVRLQDYSFKQPAVPPMGFAFGLNPVDLEIYDYPGEFVDSDLATRLATVRQEEAESSRLVGTAVSDSNRPVPGRTFQLGGAGARERHPRADLNRDYLLVQVDHRGHQPQALEEEAEPDEEPGYRTELTLMPADVQYRPPRVTPRPEALGVHTATVVGPAGEEIYTDHYGRVKVRFHWDREAPGDETSSCWMRVSQGWAGEGYGSFSLPRVGQEVLVSFLEADPDRPIITGRVYNGEQKPPYDLPAGKTRSTIKSATSPHDGGFNELRFEDAAGQEEIFLHAQQDQDVEVERDARITIDNDRSETVERDDRRTVGRNRTLDVTRESTHTGTSIAITGGQQVTFKVGSSSIVITSSTLTLSSPNISVTSGSGVVDIKGQVVKLN